MVSEEYQRRIPFLVAEELDRMSFLVAEKLQMEDALSGFRVLTNGGCPLWLQRS